MSVTCHKPVMSRQGRVGIIASHPAAPHCTKNKAPSPIGINQALSQSCPSSLPHLAPLTQASGPLWALSCYHTAHAASTRPVVFILVVCSSRLGSCVPGSFHGCLSPSCHSLSSSAISLERTPCQYCPDTPRNPGSQRGRMVHHTPPCLK